MIIFLQDPNGKPGCDFMGVNHYARYVCTVSHPLATQPRIYLYILTVLVGLHQGMASFSRYVSATKGLPCLIKRS